MAGCLDGRVVIVTGAGGGIGRAAALLCAREGARLVVNDVGCDEDGGGADPAVAASVAAEVEAAGGEAEPSPIDVADPGAADRLVALAVERFGRVDGVLSCAGVRHERSLLKSADSELERLFAVTLRAPLALLRASAQRMVEQGGGGSVLLATGPAAFFGAARQAALSALSAAIAGLVRSAAIELRRHDVRVNAIAPTARTRLTADLPLFRGIGEESMSPAHVAPVSAFLLSPLSRDVTGEVVGVAGGRIYLFRSRETAGAFREGGPPTPAEVAAAWGDITRTG